MLKFTAALNVPTVALVNVSGVATPAFNVSAFCVGVIANVLGLESSPGPRWLAETTSAGRQRHAVGAGNRCGRSSSNFVAPVNPASGVVWHCAAGWLAVTVWKRAGGRAECALRRTAGNLHAGLANHQADSRRIDAR